MKGYTRALGAFLAAALLAACSGGGTTGSVPGQQPATNPLASVKTGHIKFSIFIPSKKKTQEIRRMLDKLPGRRKPHYLPTSTGEVDFQLVSVNGNATSGNTGFDFSFQTSGCPAGGGGYFCQINEAAPAGSDVYVVTAGNSCNPAPPAGTESCADSGGTFGQEYSASLAAIAVPLNGNASAQFSLNPIVGSLQWAGGAPWTNGTNAPAYANGVGYVCSSGNCWDPLLNGASTAVSDTLVLNVKDEAGNTIVPANGAGNTEYCGTGPGTGTDCPIFITAAGLIDKMTVKCVETVGSSVGSNDTSLTWLVTGTTVPATSPVAAQIQNGFLSGTTPPSHPVFDTPATDLDAKSGTDLSGAVTAAIWGSKGAFINFDGVNTDYPLDAYDTCTAKDSTSPTALTANFFVGLGDGSITWVVNGRHAH